MKSDTYITTINCFAVGVFDTELIEKLKKVIKGSGFHVRLCGRNPFRKQFYPFYPHKLRTVFYKDGSRGVSQRGGLQHDLPLQHSTSVAVYLKGNRTINYSNRTARLISVWKVIAASGLLAQ